MPVNRYLPSLLSLAPRIHHNAGRSPGGEQVRWLRASLSLGLSDWEHVASITHLIVAVAVSIKMGRNTDWRCPECSFRSWGKFEFCREYAAPRAVARTRPEKTRVFLEGTRIACEQVGLSFRDGSVWTGLDIRSTLAEFPLHVF